MRLAFFSPLPPLRSGIADYSAELLIALRNIAYVDIDVYVDDYEVEDKRLLEHFPIYQIKDYWKNKKKCHYDLCVYQIGNNQVYHESIYKMALVEPGLVVLHDISIHNMIAGILVGRGRVEDYITEMQYNHGLEGEVVARKFNTNGGVPPWEEKDVLRFPMNKRLIDKAKGIIVHSQFARSYVKGVRREVPMKVINHFSDVIINGEASARVEARQRLGVLPGTLVLASFGYISPNRKIDEVLKALHKFRTISPVPLLYYLVGEVNNPGYKVRELINNLGLEDIVIMTGYVEMPQYMDMMKAADICLNLRYPYYGETSGNLHRMFGLGKVIVVSDVGAFSEYPDDIVIKIKVGFEVDELLHVFRRIIEDNTWKSELSKNALAFANDFCTKERFASDYISFMKQLDSGLGQIEELIEDAAETLLCEGATEDDDTRIRTLALNIMQVAGWVIRREDEVIL